MSQAPHNPADFSAQQQPQEEPRPLWRPRPKPVWPPEDFTQEAFEQRRQERLEEIARVFERIAREKAAAQPPEGAQQPGAPPVPPASPPDRPPVAPASLPGNGVASDSLAPATSVESGPTLAGQSPALQALGASACCAPSGGSAGLWPACGTERDPLALAVSVEGEPALAGQSPALQAAVHEQTTLPEGCPLLTLALGLTTYVHLGAAAPEAEPDPDLLAVLGGRVPLPEQADPLQTLLVTLFEGHLLMAAERRARRKPAAGGWRQPNRFSKADLHQWYYFEERILEHQQSGLVYDWLAEDVRLLARLGRATALAYQRRAKDKQATWKERQEATARVLLRVYQLCQHLARLGGEWFAEGCLRRAFRDLWQAQFVTRVPSPADLAPFLGEVRLPEEQRGRIVALVEAEQAAGGKVPLPFVALMQAPGSAQECWV